MQKATRKPKRLVVKRQTVKALTQKELTVVVGGNKTQRLTVGGCADG